MKQVPCRVNDPEIWFPVGYSGPAIAQAEHAKSLCHLCPIEQACLDWALDISPVSGIWGGTTETERAKMLRSGRQETERAGYPTLVPELASN